MKKSWITGITVAAVAGTGGAAFASMQATTHDNTADAAPQPAVSAVDTTAARSYSYQAGPAGTVNLTVDDGALKVDSALPTTGWTVVSYSAPASHLEVSFTDGLQIVTFIADLTGGEIVASLSAAPAPTVPTTPAPAPATAPASVAPSSQSPAPSHTSAPSGSGEHEDDDEDEHEDHEEHEDDEDGDDD